jgi:hypothetical protein
MNSVPYVDGWLGGEQEVTVIPRPRFPFKDDAIPDVYTRKYERDFRANPRQFVPKIAIRNSWTNLVLRSEDFTNASWTKVASTASTGTVTSADGRGVMNKLLETAANSEHSVAQAATVAAAATEAFVFAAAGLTREWIKITFTDSAAAVRSAFFNVASGTVAGVSGSGSSAAVYPCDGGIFRCVLRFTPAAGAGTLKINVASDAATISYAGNTANGVNLWGAQVSTGTDAPYIATEAATRAISAPIRDSVDPFSYLLGEDEPQVTNSEDVFVRRIFARVPLTRALPSSVRLTKPSLSGTFPQTIGNYVVSQPDAAQNAFDAYLRQLTISDTGPAGTGGATSSGTYTVSFDGETTAALAYNATAVALQAALNALTTVAARGGVLVTGDYVTGFVATFTTPGLMTVNSGSITISAGTLTPYVSGSNFVQSLNLTPSGGVITGGTFTITIFGQTTAPISYNASVGTAQAALNALSQVAARGGVTLAPSPDPILYGPGQIALSFGFSYPAFTVDVTSLGPTGSTATVARLDAGTSFIPGISFYGRQQSVSFAGGVVSPRTVETATAHGITAADAIYAKAGDEYFLMAAGSFTVASTTEIEFGAAAAALALVADTISEIGKVVKVGYAPGLKPVRCTRTTYFYLPGVTAGITTADDIVPPVYQGEPDTLLQAIFAGTGTINYDVSDLDAYLGAVLSLTVVTVRASDL